MQLWMHVLHIVSHHSQGDIAIDDIELLPTPCSGFNPAPNSPGVIAVDPGLEDFGGVPREAEHPAGEHLPDAPGGIPNQEEEPEFPAQKPEAEKPETETEGAYSPHEAKKDSTPIELPR